MIHMTHQEPIAPIPCPFAPTTCMLSNPLPLCTDYLYGVKPPAPELLLQPRKDVVLHHHPVVDGGVGLWELLRHTQEPLNEMMVLSAV